MRLRRRRDEKLLFCLSALDNGCNFESRNKSMAQTCENGLIFSVQRV
jgi:hypothetical protein